MHGNWKRLKEKSSLYSFAITKRLKSQNTDKLNGSSISNDNKVKSGETRYPIMERKFKLLKNFEPFEKMDTDKCQFVRGSHLSSPVRTKRKDKSRIPGGKSKYTSEDKIPMTSIKQNFGFLPMWNKSNMAPLSLAKSSPTLSSSSFSASLNATSSFTRLSELIKLI